MAKQSIDTFLLNIRAAERRADGGYPLMRRHDEVIAYLNERSAALPRSKRGPTDAFVVAVQVGASDGELLASWHRWLAHEYAHSLQQFRSSQAERRSSGLTIEDIKKAAKRFRTGNKSGLLSKKVIAFELMCMKKLRTAPSDEAIDRVLDAEFTSIKELRQLFPRLPGKR